MAEGEAPLLVLTARAGNNGSIRLLWRGCQASKHFLFILAVGTARGMRDPLCSPAPRRAGRTLLVPRGAWQTAPAGTRKAAGAAPARSTPFPEPGAVATAPNIGAVVSRAGWGCTRARQSAAGGEGDGHLGAKTRIPDPKGGNKAAGRARMLTQSSCTRLEQPQEPPWHRFL